MVRKLEGEDRTVTIGITREIHRVLRHVAAERDISVSGLLKGVIADFCAINTPTDQNFPGDVQEEQSVMQSEV